MWFPTGGGAADASGEAGTGIEGAESAGAVGNADQIKKISRGKSGVRAHRGIVTRMIAHPGVREVVVKAKVVAERVGACLMISLAIAN